MSQDVKSTEQAEPKRLLIIGSTGEQAKAREDEGRVIQIVDETGEELPGVTMRVAGNLSSRYRRAQEKQRDRWAKARKQTTGQELDEQGLELAAACVMEWTGILDEDESPLPCTKANVMRLLHEAPWVREQVEETMRDHASFFTKSSKR